MSERRIPVCGRDLHVRVEGSGPPILLVHGIPTNGELWREVVPRLATRARVIVPDLLGYGRSDPPDGLPVGIRAQADYLLGLLDALGIDRATVVGHDIGGGVAQILAVRHADRVERLGLVNSVCYDSWPIPEMKVLQATAPAVEHLPAGLTVEGIELGLRRGFVHKAKAEPYLDKFLQPFRSHRGMQVFLEHVRSLHSEATQELAPELPRLRLPVAVAWGMQDPFQKPHWGERLARDIPGAEWTPIPDASHFAPADAPAEVAAAVERLLERGADAPDR